MIHYKLSWFITCFIVTCSATRDYFDTSAFTPETEVEYIDPNSLYYDKHTKKESSPSTIGLYIDGDNSDGDQSQPCDVELRRCRMSLRNRPLNTDIAEESLSKRLVNMLLSRAIFTNKDYIFTGLIELEATELELEALRNFGKGKLTLRDADSILSKTLKMPQPNRLYGTWMWMYSMTSFTYSFFYYSMRFVNSHIYMIVGIIITMWVVWRLRKMRFKFRHIFMFCIVTIFVISFFLTWWKLIQEAEIQHSTLQMKHMQMPIHCHPTKMTWWDKITTVFASQDECHKYHEAVMKTPFLQVTPAQALSHMLSYCIHEPLALSGKSLAIFMQSVTGDMPYPVRYLTQGLMCIMLLPLLICLIIVMLGGSLNIGTFGILKAFSLKGSNQSETHNRVTGNTDRRPIEILLNITTNPPLPATPAIEAAQSNNPSELVRSDKPKKVDKVKKRKVRKEICSSTVVNEPNAGGSGDFEILHKPADSDTDTSEIVVKHEVAKFQHVGSGDSAS